MSSRVGTVLGNYRLTSLIGSGSMGDVFRGQHVQKDRTAAVKVLRGEAIATLRHHLRRDMKRVLELDHPNIVRLYELGEEDGAFFLVYEYVPDGSLRTMLQRRRESRQGGTLTQDLRLVYQASQALAYAHKRGFVHCDVKPDNLLLSRSGNVYTVKVADFGLMQLVQADAVTATDVILGTPAYMSPEQCQGLQAEPRSDIYSLGVVLYEIATGYLPFDANTPSEAIHKHVSAKPIPPREVRRDLPVRLEEIILRCLAKRPGERYPSAEALGQALVDFDRSILPAPPVVRKAPVREEETLAFPAASVPQHPQIRVLDERGHELQKITLHKSIDIGRGEENNVVLPEKVVSSRHARVDWDGTRLTVVDLGSKNHTRLGETILVPNAPREWAQGQVLKIGPYRLEVEYPHVVQKPSTIRYEEDQTVLAGGRELGAETYVSSVEATGFGEQPAEAPLPKVRVLDKAGKELQVIELRDELTIGRKEDSGIVLADRVVSLQHARLNWDGSRVTVTDLRSSNGTRLDSTTVAPDSPEVWAQGQVLKIGPYRLEVEYPEVVPKPSAARYVEDQTMPVGGRELGAETYVSSVEATGFGEQPAEAPLPKVRVLDKAGKELQVIELRDELTIGRKEDSGIVLADRVVSLQHARLNWDGSRVTVTDLRSSNGTRLGGTRLVPNTAQVWQPGDLLEIGSYRFELEQITPVVSETSMVRQLVEVDRIGVTLEENELELEPGTPTVLSVTLANHGETVDHFSLRVDGIDERWVIGPPRPPQLFPGSETVVPLTVLVPRDPASEARTYHVNVRALSKDRDWEYGQASAQWRVLPYEATEFTIAPARVRSRGDARFRIVLRNNGNVPVDYKVFADDDEQVLRYDFSNATLSAGPGETATTGLIASRARRWFGAPQPFSLNVSAVPLTKGPPQAASAQFVHQAIIPSWLPPVAILVLLFLAFSLYRWITQPPTIQNLVVEPTNPVSGQAVTVRWEVAHATEVVFLPLGDVVDASLGYHTFQEGFLDPLTLTLVARNRFNKTTEKALAIAVTPPPAELPVVEEWSVSEKEVVQGQTVTLRWRVSGAQSVYIQPFGTEALEGIREDTPQQNKTYTLIATNRDQRIERSIEVVVTPPKMAPPQIVSFTVDPSSMAGGERTKVRLQWDTRGATSVSIEPGLGAVGPKGAREIDAPEFTTTYELLATNEGGEKIARAEVEIRDALAGVFAVRGLSASVTPSESSTCPATFTFFGTITANGAGTVTYVWERSDGAQPEEQTVAFDGPGSKVVRATWTVGAPANTVSGWQQLKVVTPNAMTSQPASFSVNCPGTGTGTGPVETCISFNQDGLRVVRTDAFAGNAPVWAVSDGVVLVRQFASEADAQLAAATMERFGMNTYCTVGRPEPTMEYYLVSGRSPAGEANGEQCTTFNPERLRVRRERRWIVLRGNEWFIAGDRGFEHEFHNEAEARQALAVIQQYGFTNRCSVGSEESGFVYFRR